MNGTAYNKSESIKGGRFYEDSALALAVVPFANTAEDIRNKKAAEKTQINKKGYINEGNK